MVEGTPLLREHAVMSCIEGSNPSASANPLKPQRSNLLGLFSWPGRTRFHPRDSVLGYFNAFTRHPLFQERHFFDLKDDLSLNRGTHLVRFGAEWRYDIVDRVERFQADPMITFRGALTGDSAADLVLGLPDAIAQNSGAESYPQGSEFNVFRVEVIGE